MTYDRSLAIASGRLAAMRSLSLEERREAAIRAPDGCELHRPDTRVSRGDGWLHVVTPSAPRGRLNEVLFSKLTAAESDSVIERTIDEYRAAGQPTKWCVGPWTAPADFGERLARRGFSSWEVRGMGCSTDRDLESAPGVLVEEITVATLDAYLAATFAGWSTELEQLAPERRVHLGALAASPRAAWFFGARLDGEMVGTAGLFGRDRAGYLVGGVVLPQARGRGVYRALVAARLAFLRTRGVGYAVTQAREATSAPMLEHLGFEGLFRSSCWRLELESA
jgi:GNAT superfamily N-acetyltransferase